MDARPVARPRWRRRRLRGATPERQARRREGAPREPIALSQCACRARSRRDRHRHQSRHGKGEVSPPVKTVRALVSVLPLGLLAPRVAPSRTLDASPGSVSNSSPVRGVIRRRGTGSERLALHLRFARCGGALEAATGVSDSIFGARTNVSKRREPRTMRGRGRTVRGQGRTCAVHRGPGAALEGPCGVEGGRCAVERGACPISHQRRTGCGHQLMDIPTVRATRRCGRPRYRRGRTGTGVAELPSRTTT